MPRLDQVHAALTLARYKRLILLGKATIPLEEARRIVGPDCAYHLYFRHRDGRTTADRSRDADGEPTRPRPRRRHK